MHANKVNGQLVRKENEIRSRLNALDAKRADLLRWSRGWGA